MCGRRRWASKTTTAVECSWVSRTRGRDSRVMSRILFLCHLCKRVIETTVDPQAVRILFDIEGNLTGLVATTETTRNEGWGLCGKCKHGLSSLLAAEIEGIRQA